MPRAVATGETLFSIDRHDGFWDTNLSTVGAARSRP